MPANPPATLRMGRVALTVHDLAGVARFYEEGIGLRRIADGPDRVRLGAGQEVLLELRRDEEAARGSPAEAGLFHTAFLLPTRGDLARWVASIAGKRIRLQGASDHGVSEAIYCADPEGNGIEVYADRPRETWRWTDNAVAMGTHPLDMQDLLAAGGGQTWRGVPDGAVIGHVHLQVGAIPAAEAFYTGVLGLDLTHRYRGGSFYSADRYHHRLATNTWNSQGAGARTERATGLADVQLVVGAGRLAAVRSQAPDAAEDAEGRVTIRDPWGTGITLIAGEP